MTTKFLRINKNVFIKLDKAKPTKYIKRIPKPTGKGYYYFYNQKQLKDYKEKGKVSEKKEEKEGLFSGIMSFFGLKDEKQVKQKIKETYDANKKELSGVDVDTFSNYMNEYLQNKDKWDKKLSKKEIVTKDKKTGKIERKKVSDKKTVVTKKDKTWNLSLMKKVAGVVGEVKEVDNEVVKKGEFAREKYDLSKLEVLSDYRKADRIVYDLKDGNVLKVAKTSRGIGQTQTESKLDESFIPKIKDSGIDYVVMEKVSTPEDNKKINAVVRFFRGTNDSTEDRNRALREAEDKFKLIGISKYDGDDLMFGDLMTQDNWGIKNGKLKIIDGGIFDKSVLQRDTEDEWDDIFEEAQKKQPDKREIMSDKDKEINPPTGYNKKAWNYFVKKAKEDKQWAEEKNKDKEWKNKASGMSLDMLKKRLETSIEKLAKKNYDYTKIRAEAKSESGQSIAPDMKKKWEEITDSKNEEKPETFGIDLEKMKSKRLPQYIKKKGIDSKEYKEWIKKNWSQSMQKAAKLLIEGLEKAKKSPIGTISKDGKTKKVSEGKWVPVTDKKKDPAKDKKPKEKKKKNDKKKTVSTVNEANKETIKNTLKKFANILAEALSGKDVVQSTGKAIEETGERAKQKQKIKKEKPS